MKNRRPDGDRGVALFLVIVALLVVTAVAGGMILLSNTEINVAANYRDEQVALYAAKTGLEEARDRMLGANPNPLTLPTVLPGGSGGAYVTYIIASGNKPWLAAGPYEDTEYLKEMGLATPPSGSTWYTSVASQTSYYGPTTNPLPYQWVRVNLKIDRSAYTNGTPYYVDETAANASEQVCYNGSQEVVISAANCPTASSSDLPVYVITSYAQTPNGTHRMLQQEVTQQGINLTLPGAVTIDGPIGASASSVCASGSSCNSGGAYFNGDTPTGTDANIAACPGGTSVPAFATDNAGDATTLSTAINANNANVVGTGGSPSVGNASGALTSLSTPAEIEALVTKMKGLAGTNVGCDATKLNLGTAATPTITVVTNDGTSGTGSGCPSSSSVSLTAGSGYGILVVTGTLDYTGVIGYQGVIYMLGTAQFVSSSSKDTTLDGGIFMAKDRCASSGDSAVPGGVTCTSTGQLFSGTSLGTPSFNYHHGSASASDVSIQYNQCIINQVESTVVSNYRVLSQRELSF